MITHITDLQVSHFALSAASLTKAIEHFLMSGIVRLQNDCDNQGRHLEIACVFMSETQQAL